MPFCQSIIIGQVVVLGQVAVLGTPGQVVKLSQVVRVMERMKGAKVRGKPREDAHYAREKARDDGELRRKQLTEEEGNTRRTRFSTKRSAIMLEARGPSCMGSPYFWLKNNENEKSSETEKCENGRDRVDNGSTGAKLLVLFLSSHTFSLPPVYQSCHGWNEVPVENTS